jgi:hypothetical protein
VARRLSCRQQRRVALGIFGRDRLLRFFADFGRCIALHELFLVSEGEGGEERVSLAFIVSKREDIDFGSGRAAGLGGIVGGGVDI